MGIEKDELGVYKINWRAVVVFNLAGAALLGAFWVWMILSPDTLTYHCREDRVIENTTVSLFAVGFIAMVVATCRHPAVKGAKRRAFFLICWALLLLVFTGEEISWGQRIFDLPTPEFLKDNMGGQDELNIHNVAWVDQFWGGKFRWLTVLVLTTGFLMPVAKQFRRIGKWFSAYTLPVPQPHYIVLFVGGYLFCKLTYPRMGNPSAEVRECVFALGYMLFALHGALEPRSMVE